MEQRKESDFQAGFLCRYDVHLPIPDAHIIKPDLQTRKESDSHPAVNVNFHSQGFGGSSFQAGFVNTGINKKNKDNGCENEQPQKAGNGKEDDFQ